jgi:HNH endonuclease
VQELVATHEYGDLPDDPAIPDLRPRKMSLELAPEVVALWRQARVALQDERGIGDVSDGDLMETLCRRFLNPGTGAEGPANNIGYQQCPDCKRTQVNGAGRMLDVRREMAERLLCDVRILGNLGAPHPERIMQSVTPRMRAQVFARDQCRCQVPGCRATRFLEVHHIIPQADGGPHVLSNLTLICDGHHRALHAGLLFMSGRAPLDVQFQWKFKPIDIIEGPTDPTRPLAVPPWVLGEGQTFDALERVIARVRRDQREKVSRDVRDGVPGAIARWARANDERASVYGTKESDARRSGDGDPRTVRSPGDVPAETRHRRGK